MVSVASSRLWLSFTGTFFSYARVKWNLGQRSRLGLKIESYQREVLSLIPVIWTYFNDMPDWLTAADIDSWDVCYVFRNVVSHS